MASVDNGTNNPNDPNNPNNVPGNVQPGGQTNQPATTSGAGGVTATGAGNVTGQVVGTANPSQPFQNISSYLAANEPQSQKLATDVAQTAAAPITEAQTGITNAAQDFSKSVNAGYAPANNDLISAVSANPAYVVAENPDNVANFLGQLNNTYKGPTDFTQTPGFSDIEAKIAAAQNVANNTQNESGIQTLLKSVEGPTTAGNNKLDSLLLNVNPDNLKTIQKAGEGAANLLPTLNKTTAEQNALAATGATTASKTAADARAALDTARGTESTNLTNEQNSIQDIVNQYNQSVGVINPVVQAITQSISDFFAQNPNVKLPTTGDPLADIKNLTAIAMPELATYASPEDYAQIAALTKLGDTSAGNLPISASQSNLAETFNVPTALQDAIGKAPGVEKALQDLLTGVGGQINSAVAPFQEAQQAASAAEAKHAEYQKQFADLTAQLRNTPQYFTDANTGASTVNPAYGDLKAKIASLQDAGAGADYSTMQSLAQQLQWVNGTETSYQQLVDAINTQLGKLGSIGAPTLTYGPSATSAIKSGDPIGLLAPKDVANTASVGVGAGIPAATAAGLLAATAPTTASELAGAGAGTVAGEVPAAGLTAAQSLGPAALAAYGTSNIVQNSIKHPIESGLMTLANTGLSLATLSLPPQIFLSIGKDINKVFNSIGNFFGGLF